MIDLSEQQLSDLQRVVAWETAMCLPDGRVLGREGKRGLEKEGDFRIRFLDERIGLADKTVLELGCNEGVHTVQLARRAERVVALDVRPKNIVCTLVRLFVADLLPSTQVLLKDVRDLEMPDGPFDVLFHVGVLYHLYDPIDHLRRIAHLAPVLLLDTHYATEPTRAPRSDIVYGDRSYPAFSHREGGWDEVFSGVEETSRWIRRDDLLDLLRKVGFERIETVSDREERNGSRITILAERGE
jgi:SAM-dependent methyltransferase